MDRTDISYLIRNLHERVEALTEVLSFITSIVEEHDKKLGCGNFENRAADVDGG